MALSDPGSIGGLTSQLLKGARTALDVDSSSLSKVIKDFRVLKQLIKDTKKEIDDLSKSSSGASGSLSATARAGSKRGGSGGGRGAAGRPLRGGWPLRCVIHRNRPGWSSSFRLLQPRC